MHKFLDGLASLRSPFNILMVFLTSLVIWLLETGKYWLVMHAFNFNVSFFALMLMNGIVNLATTIPSAPGYIGTFDAPGIAVLTAYGVNQATAAGYTLVLHVALWLPITLVGAYFLTREGIKWNDSLRDETQASTKPRFAELSQLYGFVEELIKTLNRSGNTEWADKIETAIRGGSTSNEILGRVRSAFLGFQQSDVPQRISCREDVREAIDWIDHAIGYWRP